MTEELPLKNYEIAILKMTGGVCEIGVSDVDPEQALDSAVRIFIRDFVRANRGVLEDPHLDTEGVKEAIASMTGARVYERFYPVGLGLRQKLVLDFDKKTLRDKANRVFENAA